MSILVNVVSFAASVLWQHDGRITGFDPGGRKEGKEERKWDEERSKSIGMREERKEVRRRKGGKGAGWWKGRKVVGWREERKEGSGMREVRKERKRKEEKEGSFIALLSILVNVDSFAVSVHQEKTANVLAA